MMPDKYEYVKKILMQDLQLASGCTEPIALALAGAKTREILGRIPEKVDVFCSGNIIKNAMAVVIPNSGGKRGIKAAVAMGMAGGMASKKLCVLEELEESCIKIAEKILEEKRIHVYLQESEDNLYIRIEAQSGAHGSLVELKGDHDVFRRVEIDGIRMHYETEKREQPSLRMRDRMSLEMILEFALEGPIMEENNRELREKLYLQAVYNESIGREGICKGQGMGIGKTLFCQNLGGDPVLEGIAVASGGSDARMNGCKLPVIINSGSGNQGITIACPIVVYWKSAGKTEEALYRALALANLIAIYEKSKIGKLSAYCGAVTAAAAAGAGLAYLMGMSRENIVKTAENVLAIGSGILCDGAKASCAAKIAASLNCTKLALNMTEAGQHFHPGEGIVAENLGATIENVGIIAREGMRETDKKILKIMMGVEVGEICG